MTTPHMEAKLPELTAFTRMLAKQRQNGTLKDWDAFKQQCSGFYTSGMMDKIDSLVSSWNHMASYADRQTLIHVTSVLVALFLLPEYQSASADHKRIMEWMVLFHDVAKQAKPNEHDYTHAFRSAAVAGAALEPIGFPAHPDFDERITAWKMLVNNAAKYDSAHNETIQDNTVLPEIISGIDALYSPQSDAALIIKGVLLHLSIANDPGYPTLAPLTPSEAQRYIDRDLFPILKAMMLVDSDGWNLFDPAESQRLRLQTLDRFDTIARQNAIV